MPAPVDGTLKEIKAAEGATVLSDDLLAIIEEGAVAPEPEAEPETEAKACGRSTLARPRAATPPAAKAATEESSKLSPAARRVAEEEKVDPASVSGTGRGGRVTKGDVINFIKGGGSRQEERVKMTRLRSRIAERMKEAQNTAAILTSFNEVDLKAVMDLRRKYKEQFIARHDIKLGLMSFFVKACCDALRKFPTVNASIDGDEIVYHNYQDVGIAVSTERGLMVPVIRNAENMGLAEIEHSISPLRRQSKRRIHCA